MTSIKRFASILCLQAATPAALAWEPVTAGSDGVDSNALAAISLLLPACEEYGGSGPLGLDPLVWLLIGAGVLLLGGAGVFVLGSMGVIAIGRRNRAAPGGGVYRCLRCGHELPAKGATCPSCGYRESYQESG